MIAKLSIRSEAAGSRADAIWDAAIQSMQALGKVTGRNRITPISKSVLTPTSEEQGETPVRPHTDWPDFDRLAPNPPR